MDTITRHHNERRPMTPRAITPAEWLKTYSQLMDNGCIIFTGQKNQSGYGDVRGKVKNGAGLDALTALHGRLPTAQFRVA